MGVVRLWEQCPWTDDMSDYDRRHLALYAWLLEAETEGGSEDEMARVLFHIDPVKEPQRARRVVGSHLRRARWLAENGHPYLRW